MANASEDLDALFRRESRRLISVLTPIGPRNLELAEEVAQESFLGRGAGTRALLKPAA